MGDVLWTIEGVRLGGRGAPRLDDVSLVIRAGVTAVVGYSGAGKTSLLNLLVGYERADAGVVRWSEPRRSEVGAAVGGKERRESVSAPHPRPLSRGRGERERKGAGGGDRLAVFWGPQDDGLWPRVTVAGHVELVAGGGKREIASEVLRAFDLEGVSGATPERLSRGEASRVAVARGVASGTAALVLDEPLAHVDPARRRGYWERLLGYVKESGASLVFASHEPADVLRYADRVIGLRDGRVVFDGEVRELYEAAPDEAAAALLGPVNWLAAEERGRWRVGETTACVRPERLDVEPAADGAGTVVVSRAGGAVDESELRCEATGEVRRFLHRPARRRLEPGTRVKLTVLGMLAALALVGCGPGAEGPQLEIASETRFALPVHEAELPAPRDVTVGLNDEKVILDNAGRVLVYGAAGKLVRQWDMPESSVGNPEGACVLPDGRVVVADTHYHRVVTFDAQGKVLGMFGELGRGPGQFIYPVAVTADPAGNLYVAEYGENDRVQKFGPDGKFITAFGSFGAGEGQFQRPSGIVWLDGKLYVVDAFNSLVHVFADSGEYEGLLGASDIGLHYPYDLSLGRDGRLYVVEYGAGRVTVLTTAGEVVGRYGHTGHGRGEFATPWGLAVDQAGRIWVADTGNRRMVELVPEGVKVAGSRESRGGESRDADVRTVLNHLEPQDRLLAAAPPGPSGRATRSGVAGGAR